MKKEEALKILDQVCAQTSLSRAGHIQVQIALDVLRKVIEEPKEDDSKSSK